MQSHCTMKQLENKVNRIEWNCCVSINGRNFLETLDYSVNLDSWHSYLPLVSLGKLICFYWSFFLIFWLFLSYLNSYFINWMYCLLLQSTFLCVFYAYFISIKHIDWWKAHVCKWKWSEKSWKWMCNSIYGSQKFGHTHRIVCDPLFTIFK